MLPKKYLPGCRNIVKTGDIEIIHNNKKYLFLTLSLKRIKLAVENKNADTKAKLS